MRSGKRRFLPIRTPAGRARSKLILTVTSVGQRSHTAVKNDVA
jgi:hypothetical protein